jgi:hypothetical protein
MKSFSVFFITSIGTAFLTYLFQVLLALKLGTSEFSNFTLYWSYFGLSSIVGSFAQYWSSLNCIAVAKENNYRKIIHLLSLLLLILSLVFHNIYLLVACLAIENISLSFIIGRCIRENDFKTVNIFNIVLSCLKVLLLFILPKHFLNTKGVLCTILISFISIEIIRFIFQSKTLGMQKVLKGESIKLNWSGPLLFSILACTIPQVDILWVNYFKSFEGLSIMAELSFITKALFFLQMIFAQWLFPKQINGNSFSSLKLLKYLMIYFVLISTGAFFFSHFLPVFIVRFLSWKIIPSQHECFWAGINAGMMSLFFQISQDNIIRKKVTRSFLSFCFLIVLIVFAGVFKVSIVQYFQTSSAACFLIFIFYTIQVYQRKT